MIDPTDTPQMTLAQAFQLVKLDTTDIAVLFGRLAEMMRDSAPSISDELNAVVNEVLGRSSP